MCLTICSGVYDLGLNLLPRKGLPAHIFEKMTKKKCQD